MEIYIVCRNENHLFVLLCCNHWFLYKFLQFLKRNIGQAFERTISWHRQTSLSSLSSPASFTALRTKCLQSAARKSVTPQAYCIEHDSVGLNTIQGKSTVVSGSLWEDEKKCAPTEMLWRQLFDFASTSLALCLRGKNALFCHVIAQNNNLIFQWDSMLRTANRISRQFCLEAGCSYRFERRYLVQECAIQKPTRTQNSLKNRFEVKDNSVKQQRLRIWFISGTHYQTRSSTLQQTDSKRG